MRTAQRENPEARRVREQVILQRNRQAFEVWSAQRTRAQREAKARLPQDRYNAFIAAALLQRAHVESVLAGAGFTVSKRNMEGAREGLDEELRIIAEVRGGQERDEFAAPDEQEEIFGEAEQRF